MIDDFRPAPRREKSLAKIQTRFQAEEPKTETPFQTPEQVALNDAPEAPGKTVDISEKASAAPLPPIDMKLPEVPLVPKKGFHLHPKLVLRWPPGKKEIIIAVVTVLLITGGLGSYILAHHATKAVVAPKIVKKIAPKPVVPTTVPSALTGLPVDPSVNNRVVLAVMIENSIDARPQRGLGEAGVVFEAIAEGGITRFLALFQDTSPAVGPVRSVRPYYVQWAQGFDAPIAHVGGSPEALATIRSAGLKDLDQFFNAGAYHRTDDREAPHNVYSDIGTLSQLAAGKGYASSTFTSWTRKKEAPAKAITAKTIDFALSGPLYNAHYDYDTATNSYKRSEGGAAHMDANTNAQISPKVVIALVMPYGIQADGKHSDYGTIGSGTAYVFQDGSVTVGTWTKSDATSQFSFTDGAGKPIALNPGNTWISALDATSKVSYAP